MLLLILPDWNSLDSVRHTHSNLEAAGLVFFALLVISEALAHSSRDNRRKDLFDSIGIWFFAIAVLSEIAGYWYGQRNDTLSEQIIVSLSETARQAANDAGTARTDSGTAMTQAGIAEDAAGKATSKADKASTTADKAEKSASGALALAGEAEAEVATVQSNIAKINERDAPRTLSKIKREILIDRLRKARVKPQEPIRVSTTLDAPDATAYAAEIIAAISDPSTGWKAVVDGTRLGTPEGIGVSLSIRDEKLDPIWGLDLQQALQLAGIGGKASVDPKNGKAGGWEIIVGRKH